MKYRFIASHAHEYEVKIMYRVLEVSVSGYYAWRQRAPSARQQAAAALVEQIRDVHEQSRRTYGSPRVHAALGAMGIRCSRKRVARLMRLHGLRGCDRRRYHPCGTDSQHSDLVATNALARDFTANAPNQKWLADVSYIDTQEGFLYLAALEDVYSRKIIGWAMGTQPTAALVKQALEMALARRQPSAGTLHHSDRGSQYASETYRRLLTAQHLSMRMSRTGNCLDNAMMESFFATLKAECATMSFPSRAAARTAIFEFIEVFYNRQRLHSALGYVSPEAFERPFERTFL
jgi:putative transposase